MELAAYVRGIGLVRSGSIPSIAVQNDIQKIVFLSREGWLRDVHERSELVRCSADDRGTVGLLPAWRMGVTVLVPPNADVVICTLGTLPSMW